MAVALNTLTLQDKHNIVVHCLYITLHFRFAAIVQDTVVIFCMCHRNFPINILHLQNIVIFYTVFIEIFSHCSDCSFNLSFLLFFTGPPVIINNSVILLEDDEGCLLNVMFYSFHSNVKMTWYKNGRRLISSEKMKQSLTSHKHLVEMHSILVPIDAKIATLRITLVCDLDDSIYSFTAYDVLFRTSYIFEKDGKLIIKFQCSFLHTCSLFLCFFNWTLELFRQFVLFVILIVNVYSISCTIMVCF